MTTSTNSVINQLETEIPWIHKSQIPTSARTNFTLSHRLINQCHWIKNHTKHCRWYI